MDTVHLLFTGGTIAMRTDAQGMLVPAISGDEMIAAIPQLANVAGIRTQQLCNVASSHLSSEIWLQLCRKIITLCGDETVSGVVVVQGTDTLEETAFFLDAALSNHTLRNKPVVLTGAMRNADETDADGSANLLAAVRTAAAAQARGQGVLVCMYGRIHAPRFVRKVHTTRTDAFASFGHEALGECSSQGEVVLPQPPARLLPTIDDVSLEFLPRVDIVSTHIDADSCHIEAAIRAGAAGIIIEALGAGNVNPSVAAGIEGALGQGIPVVIASRCISGMVEPVYGYIGGGQYLQQKGAVSAHDLPAHKARIYLQLLLAQAGATQNPLHAVAAGFAQLAR